jgi:hypothetical protein
METVSSSDCYITVLSEVSRRPRVERPLQFRKTV